MPVREATTSDELSFFDLPVEALKFVGVAFFFMSIVSGLHTIVFALQYQQKAIPQVVQKVKTVDSLDLNQSFAPAPASGD